MEAPPPSRLRYLLAAVYLGPYRGLAALERELGPKNCVFVLDGPAAEERKRRGLPFVRRASPRGFAALIRGVSKTPVVENLETRLAARFAERGLPVFAVEDYPGQLTADQPAPDALFVESASAKRLHERRGLASRILVTGNPRYSEIPRRANRKALRARLGLGNEPVVLWAGQPDSYGNAETLKALIPHLRRLGASLIHRPHPYTPEDGPKIEGLRVVDGSKADGLELAGAADLVATQFSTLAVEAAYAGTPSLFILLPGLGRKRHLTSTGMIDPPWCRDGLAFIARRRREIGPQVERALGNKNARRKAQEGFKRLRYESRNSPRRIARLVEKITGKMI